MIKIILLCFLFSFARDPFLDFRKLRSLKENTKNVKNTRFIYLGLAGNEPILKLNSTLIFPLENTSFKVYYFNVSCISFKYKKKLYKILR